jgi:hypothetical protein
VELPAEALEPAPQDGTSGSIGASMAADQAGYGSPKVEALLYHLRRDAAASAAAEPGVPAIRSIVFSQFTKFLDVVQAALRAEGFHVSRLDGSTSAKKRGEVLRAFQSGKPSRQSTPCCRACGPVVGALSGCLARSMCAC